LNAREKTTRKKKKIMATTDVVYMVEVTTDDGAFIEPQAFTTVEKVNDWVIDNGLHLTPHEVWEVPLNGGISVGVRKKYSIA
jgi:hypothetical protein